MGVTSLLFQILSTRWQQRPQVLTWPKGIPFSLHSTEPHPRQASLGHILSGRWPAPQPKDALPSGMLWKSLTRQTKMLQPCGKTGNHSSVHSFILSANMYPAAAVSQASCLGGACSCDLITSYTHIYQIMRSLPSNSKLQSWRFKKGKQPRDRISTQCFPGSQEWLGSEVIEAGRIKSWLRVCPLWNYLSSFLPPPLS
jgi:hypothetical protein